MINLILFPSSYFSINRIDEELENELNAVRETGLFDTVLFGYDKWIDEGKLILNEKPPIMRKAVMRGWMMKPEKYELFYNELLKNNIQLVTSPMEYEQMHIFPNIYTVFGADTAKMRLYKLHKRIDVCGLKNSFDKFMVKDYVKSVKGTDFPKYFDNTVTQAEFDKQMELFYKYRGSLLTGGICVKEFLDLKLYNGRPNEHRVFYINGEIGTVSRNSGQASYTAEPPTAMLQKYRNLPSCYYTVDYAEISDGSWKVIEAGDGSVSGLSDNQDMFGYFRALYYAFNK